MAKHVYRFHVYQPHQTDWRGQAPTLGWQPHVDVYHSDSHLLVQVEAPGVDEASLRLQFAAGQLLIEGHRHRPALPAATRCLCMEIEYGPFARSIELPANANGDGIEARYESGVLTVSVPLRENKQSPSLRVSID